MKMPLDPDSLVVDSFDLDPSASLLGTVPEADNGESGRYCTWYQTCQTCFTDCPCA